MKNSTAVLSLSGLLLFSGGLASFGQGEPPPWQWAGQNGGEATSINATRIAVDDSGNSYVTGAFTGTAAFGSVTLAASGGETDIYLMKVDPLGEVIWAQSAGGFGEDAGKSVAVDADGNSYVTGFFQGNASFGGLALTGDFSTNIFLAKYNAAGAIQWVRSAGGSGEDDAWAVALDGAGNPTITGYFNGTAAFGSLPPLVSAGGYDIFVAAYSASGGEQWAVRAGGAGFGHEGEGGRDLAVDAAGDVYVSGNFVGSAHFGGSTVTSSGRQDLFVAKYSPAAGTWVWVTQGGGNGDDVATSLELDSLGNVYIAGLFSDTAILGGTTITASFGFSWINQDYFVAKVDSSGTLQWVRVTGGVGSYAGHGISVDAENNVYLAATFDGTVPVGDTTLTSGGFDNVYVVKFDAAGVSQWVVQSSGDYFNIAAGIAVDPFGGLYLAGWFLGSAEFGETTLVKQGSTEVSVAKMGFPIESPLVAVRLDIRPGSCENPFQAKSRGVLPLAILGAEDFDVAAIDLSTVTMWRGDGVGGAVAPLASPGPGIEDVGECEGLDADGVLDLTMKFSVEELVEILELADLPRGSEVELVISGSLLDGTEFAGFDYVLMR